MRPTDRHRIMRICLLIATFSTTLAVNAQESAFDGMLQENQRPRRTIREELVPEAIDGRFRLPTLDAPSTTLTIAENRQAPQSYLDERDAPTAQLPESASQRGVPWNWTVLNWEAADTFSNPRYFEDRMLERHGQECFGHFQPLASGARFFATVPMLPYLMTVSEPCECEYTLGYYRSGSRTPAFMQRPPYERRAMIMEGLVVSGVVIGFP